MPMRQGVELLLHGYPEEDVELSRADAEQIIERFGGLALAIDQAAAYIKYKRLKPSQLKGFLATYEEERRKVLQYIPKHVWDYNSTQIDGQEDQKKAISAFTTWNMSLEQLSSASGPESKDVEYFLTLMGFLGPVKIEEFMLQRWWESSKAQEQIGRLFCSATNNNHDNTTNNNREDDVIANVPDHKKDKRSDIFHQWWRSLQIARVFRSATNDNDDIRWDSRRFWDVIEKAASLSLIHDVQLPQADKRGASFLLHPLIRDWLQLREKSRSQETFTKDALSVVIAVVRTYQDEQTTPDLRALVLSHVDACLKNDQRYSRQGSKFMTNTEDCNDASWIASFFFDQGHYTKSASLERQELKRRQEIQGGSHPQTLHVMRNLGATLIEQEEYQEAEVLLRPGLEACEVVYGKEHSETYATMSVLATALEGDPAEAEELYRQVLKGREEILGRQHPKTLNTMISLAYSLGGQQKYGEAEAVSQNALSACEKVLGKEHTETLRALDSLALMLASQGKDEEAEKLYRKALGGRERVLGRESPMTLKTMDRLAFVLEKRQKYQEVEDLLRITLEVRDRVLGREHPSTLFTMHNLALAMSMQHKFQAAEDLGRITLGGRNRVLGEENPITLFTMHSLADVLAKQQKYQEAEELWRATLQGCDRVLGREHPNTLSTMHKLANVLTNQQKYQEAEDLWRATLECSNRVLGSGHARTLATCGALVCLMRIQGKDKEADALLLQQDTTADEVAKYHECMHCEGPDQISNDSETES